MDVLFGALDEIGMGLKVLDLALVNDYEVLAEY